MALHHGRAEVSGEFARLIQQHDVRVQISQNGEHGVERMFSSAISNGHRVTAHEATVLEHAARSRAHTNLFRHRGAKGHRSRGTPGHSHAAPPGHTPGARSQGSHAKSHTSRPTLPVIPRLATPRVTPLSYAITSLAGAAAATAMYRNNRSQPHKGGAHRTSLPSPDHTLLVEQPLSHARHAAPETQAVATSAEDSADESQDLARRVEQLRGTPVVQMLIEYVRKEIPLLAQRRGVGLLPPDEGGAVDTYRNVVQGLVQSQLRNSAYSRAERRALALAVELEMTQGRTVDELYSYLHEAAG